MAGRPKASVLGATSSGLALAAAMAGRFGPVAVWEPDPDIGRPARNAPGVGAVSNDLQATVRDTSIVACTVPHREIAGTLEALGPLLCQGAILIISTVGHEAAHAAAASAIPPHASVACVTWFPPPADGTARHPRAPGPVMAVGISPAPAAHPDAVGVVQAIIEVSGAVPFFGDAREIDGFAAATLALPAVIGAAVVRAALGARSSRDLDRVGGGPLATLTSVIDTDAPTPEALNAVGDHLARALRTIAEDLRVIASRLEATSPDPAAIETAIERRRAWMAARATTADAPLLADLPQPRRRRLFF